MLTRFLIVGLLVWRAAIAAVPTPESHFGHPIGVDRKLLDWSKVVSYFDALAKSSDRIKVEELGKSTEGRPFIAAWISSPENIKNLDHYRDIQAKLADPRIEDPPSVFADYLRSLPSTIRLFVAVDAAGVVRATSGCGAFGTQASVMFVNTDPNWRGLGIGQAMTAAALSAAQGLGAQHACLDATDAGQSIYSRLGFETVAPITRFFRDGPRQA